MGHKLHINVCLTGCVHTKEDNPDLPITPDEIFNDVEKCKGVKKKHKKLVNNDKELVIEQEQFTRFKTALRKNESDTQTVNNIVKHFDKTYDKGIVKNNGCVIPYEVIE